MTPREALNALKLIADSLHHDDLLSRMHLSLVAEAIVRHGVVEPVELAPNELPDPREVGMVDRTLARLHLVKPESDRG